MSCWTAIEKYWDDFIITCECGWSRIAPSHEDAVKEARDHREESNQWYGLRP